MKTMKETEPRDFQEWLDWMRWLKRTGRDPETVELEEPGRLTRIFRRVGDKIREKVNFLNLLQEDSDS